MEDNLGDTGMQSPRRAGAFRTAVLVAMPDLTAADPLAAAGLVLRCMPTEHSAVVHALAPHPEAQFNYLRVRHCHCRCTQPTVPRLWSVRCQPMQEASLEDRPLHAFRHREACASGASRGSQAIPGMCKKVVDTCHMRLLP